MLDLQTVIDDQPNIGGAAIKLDRKSCYRHPRVSFCLVDSFVDRIAQPIALATTGEIQRTYKEPVGLEWDDGL